MTEPTNDPWTTPNPSGGQPPPPPPAASPGYGPPGYGPPGYGPPGYPPTAPYYGGPQVARKTNGLAIASMVLGIVWIYWIGSVLALVFGYIARRQIRERGESGDGMAIAGIVLGWVGVGFFTLFVIGGILIASPVNY